MPEIQLNHLNHACKTEKLVYKENTLVFSDLKSFYKPIQSEGISIKYVASGIENYVINNKVIALKSKECFISNQPLDGHVSINSDFSVKGTCLNITHDLIRKIESSLADSKYFEGQDIVKDSILDEEIFDVFNLGNSLLSQKILDINQKGQGQLTQEVENSETLFFEFGEAFVLDQKPWLLYFTRLNNAKKDTKKEIIKRLLWAKEHLEAHFNMDLKVSELARIAAMSDFHFSRLFKQVFGYAPYQFQLKLRMDKAKILLEGRGTMVQDVGLAVGYSDIYTFSKAFKRYFGLYPSSFLQ
jgi:AraC family transcriptional regulator